YCTATFNDGQVCRVYFKLAFSYPSCDIRFPNDVLVATVGGSTGRLIPTWSNNTTGIKSFVWPNSQVYDIVDYSDYENNHLEFEMFAKKSTYNSLYTYCEATFNDGQT